MAEILALWLMRQQSVPVRNARAARFTYRDALGSRSDPGGPRSCKATFIARFTGAVGARINFRSDFDLDQFARAGPALSLPRCKGDSNVKILRKAGSGNA